MGEKTNGERPGGKNRSCAVFVWLRNFNQNIDSVLNIFLDPTVHMSIKVRIS